MENAEIIIDVVVYFNMLGIVYLLLHSIILRRSLVSLHLQIDRKEVSPSDYALLVRNIPLTTNKEELIKLVEARFMHFKLKVQYVNFCYNIEQMVKLNTQIKELVKQKGFYKLHVKKSLRA